MYRETTWQKKCTEKPHGKKNVQRKDIAKKMYRETPVQKNAQRNHNTKKCTDKPQTKNAHTKHKRKNAQTTDEKNAQRNHRRKKRTEKQCEKKTHRETISEKNA